MSGIALQIDLTALDGAGKALGRLGRLEKKSLLNHIGSEVENQTRRRISDEKTAPDGADWEYWSGEYSLSRHMGQSLLQSEGNLLDDMAHFVQGDYVEVGSGLIYAAAHQFGYDGKNIPARPYLGLSPENEEDVQSLIDDFLEDHMKEALR